MKIKNDQSLLNSWVGRALLELTQSLYVAEVHDKIEKIFDSLRTLWWWLFPFLFFPPSPPPPFSRLTFV